MVNRFNISEATEVQAVGRFYTVPHFRSVCPNCVNHEQGEVDKVHDCKNIFVDDQDRTFGQCCCYSKEHGIRK